MCGDQEGPLEGVLTNPEILRGDPARSVVPQRGNLQASVSEGPKAEK